MIISGSHVAVEVEALSDLVVPSYPRSSEVACP